MLILSSGLDCSKMQDSQRDLLARFSLMVLFGAISVYGMKKVIEMMDPFTLKRQKAKEEVNEYHFIVKQILKSSVLFNSGTENPTIIRNRAFWFGS